MAKNITPIQQAINFCTPELSGIRAHLESLLTQEEAFAKSFFKAGEEYESLCRRGFKEEALSFQETFNQFKKQ